MRNRLKYLLLTVLFGVLCVAACFFFLRPSAEEVQVEEKTYREIVYPTQNYDRVKVNEVRGVVLHHTALPTIERSLEVLTTPINRVGTHCLIDTDGTRYILCDPEVVTFHAGKSVLNDREKCNEFTIGIEFQGNTLEEPLTDDQICSAIQYLLPVIDRYHISLDSIVTHEMIRDNFMLKYPEKRTKNKIDITSWEYRRVMKALRAAYQERHAQ